MKKTILMVLFVVIALAAHAQKGKIISQSQGSITFAVDENLPAIDTDEYKYLFSGEDIARSIMNDEGISEETKIITLSFAENDNMRKMGKDPFFKCIVNAYANHMSVTLSPDMIWLLISQGFARYVNAHSEELRSQLVEHEGKMDLVVESGCDLLSGDADWPRLLDSFAGQIEKYTKATPEGSVAGLMTADFTTTGQTERIASEITLMEGMKSYFNYIVLYVACGIPSITIKGTPEDWQQVLAKTRRLGKYGLDEWVKELEPILVEFANAAAGNPRIKFWKGIVKKKLVKKFKGGGCSPDRPTALDGWLLKFFPDENGKTLGSVPHTKSMPSERVRVDFKYCVIDPSQGTVVSETPMELWAGFVGIEVDTVTNTLMPKIGWMVSVAEGDDKVLEKLREQDEEMGINIRVADVPEVLAKLEHITSLNIEFTKAAVIPDWFYTLSIDYLTVSGQLDDNEKEKIKRAFPNANIR